MSDTYITAKELREIAGICDAFNPVWNRLIDTSTDISLETEYGFEYTVFDSNGEVLGRIKWCESGAAFYPETKEN